MSAGNSPCGESGITALLCHKGHSIASPHVHSADGVLLAAADAVADATLRPMEEPDLGTASDQPSDSRIRDANLPKPTSSVPPLSSGPSDDGDGACSHAQAAQ